MTSCLQNYIYFFPDDTTTMINNDTVTADQYNNIQRRKWQSSDLNSKKHNFLTVSPEYHGLNLIFLYILRVHKYNDY